MNRRDLVRVTIRVSATQRTRKLLVLGHASSLRRGAWWRGFDETTSIIGSVPTTIPVSLLNATTPEALERCAHRLRRTMWRWNARHECGARLSKDDGYYACDECEVR